MTNEEKEVIDKLKNGKKYTLVEIIRVFKREGIENFIITRKEYIETILNLLEKQDNRIKELESDKEIKDKMIELMSNLIYNWDAFNNYGSRKDIKQYYENLAKESGDENVSRSN